MRRLRERCLVLALTSRDCNGPLRLLVRRLTEESVGRSWHAATAAPVRTRRAADPTAHGRPPPSLVTPRDGVTNGAADGAFMEPRGCNRWLDRTQEPRRQAKRVAVGCDRLHAKFDG